MKVQVAISALLLAAAVSPARAQDSSWHYLIEPYVMFPNMKGETRLGALPPVHVDEDPQDIFDNLQIGAMLYFEARNDQWAFSSDVLYMDLGAEKAEQGNFVSNGSVGVSQLGWELAAMRRVAPWLEVGLSAVYNQIDADVKMDIRAPLTNQISTVKAGHTEDWIDPTIVARATFPLGDKWFFHARANLGGFGIGSASDLMWQVQADVGYRPSEKWQFSFGYRFIDYDYERGTLGTLDYFAYDMQTFGPVIRLGYSF